MLYRYSAIIKLFRKIFTPKRAIQPPRVSAIIIPRKQHAISHQAINRHALSVVSKLKQAGFDAYIVGGSIRDLLLGKEPKDFDVATNARPEQVRKLFHNCRLIGRRFRLAHVFFGREIIEVATFRGNTVNQNNGMLLRDNVYGTLAEDALRRDFTVNALYYNITNNTIIDYSTGMQDLQRKILRLLGDPELRYQEDPVRMLRAIRFAAKLDFQLAEDTAKPILKYHHLLQQIAPARLFDEVIKIFFSGHGLACFKLLREFHLFGCLFAPTQKALEQESSAYLLRLLELTFHNTDQRLAEGKPVTPAFIFAALLWQPIQEAQQRITSTEKMPAAIALDRAIEVVLREQLKQIAIPRRFTQIAREIWHLQSRLIQRHKNRAANLLNHPRFRAAYDFLLLRCAAGEPLQEVADWWTQFQSADAAEQQAMLQTKSTFRRRRPHKKFQPKAAA